MRIIGALSQSGQKTVIYFCECTKHELDNIDLLLPKTAYCMARKAAEENQSLMLAIESSDELVNERRCVGMIFTDTDGYCIKALSNRHENIAESMEEIYDWTYNNVREDAV